MLENKIKKIITGHSTVKPTIIKLKKNDPAPIDGGASIVAAACTGYLARKRNILNKKKVAAKS
jgi:hypothetical protein